MGTVKKIWKEHSEKSLLSDYGSTPLYNSIFCSKFDIAKYLLENGASISALNEDDDTALHAAARVSSEELVTILLNKNGDPNKVNSDGFMPLETLCRFLPLHSRLSQGNMRIAELLIGGLKENSLSKSNPSPINAFPEVISLLEERRIYT